MGAVGIVLPPNALGVLTNNGSGATNWSTSIPGTWIGAGTLPVTATDTTWAPRTNYLSLTNITTGTVGQVFTPTGGTNGFGSPTVVPTNWFTMQMPTNSLAAPLVDFSIPMQSTNMSGTLTFTGISNPTSGKRDSTIVVLYPSGSDRQFVLVAGWATNNVSLVGFKFIQGNRPFVYEDGKRHQRNPKELQQVIRCLLLFLIAVTARANSLPLQYEEAFFNAGHATSGGQSGGGSGPWVRLFFDSACGVGNITNAVGDNTTGANLLVMAE